MSGPKKPMDNFETFRMPLDNFGAPGFTLKERVDFSGHKSGRVDPHVNLDILNSNDEKLTFYKRKVGDLCNNQLPGFNGMQDLFKK